MTRLDETALIRTCPRDGQRYATDPVHPGEHEGCEGGQGRDVDAMERSADILGLVVCLLVVLIGGTAAWIFFQGCCR